MTASGSSTLTWNIGTHTTYKNTIITDVKIYMYMYNYVYYTCIYKYIIIHVHVLGYYLEVVVIY